MKRLHRGLISSVDLQDSLDSFGPKNQYIEPFPMEKNVVWRPNGLPGVSGSARRHMVMQLRPLPRQPLFWFCPETAKCCQMCTASTGWDEEAFAYMLISVMNKKWSGRLKVVGG